MSINVHQWAMSVARITAQRGNCARRKVGAVILDYDDNLIAVGYNGVVSKYGCDSGELCPGAKAKTGTRLDECYAIHAEQMALINCEHKRDLYTIYLTCTPCISCVKILLHTSICRIIYETDYHDSEIARDLWMSSKINTRWQNLKEFLDEPTV